MAKKANEQIVTIAVEGFQAKVTQQVVSDVRDALTAQSGITDRYVKLEPSISTAFGAPECYTSGTPQRAALTKFLQDQHPLAAEIEKVQLEIEALTAKGDVLVANKKKVERDVLARRRHTDVQNALRAFALHYKAGKAGERSERKRVTLRARLEATVKTLEKYTKDEYPAQERELAAEIVAYIRGKLGITDQVAAPRTVGMDAKKPSKVKVLTPEEIEALADAE